MDRYVMLGYDLLLFLRKYERHAISYCTFKLHQDSL